MEAEGLRELVNDAAERAGLLLVDVQMVQTGRRRLVRVLADRRGRITVGECASLSREIADLLDAHGVIDGGYTLEVSSPGIGRPLSTGTDWLRCEGRNLSVRTEEGEHRGILSGVEDGFLVLDGDVRISLDHVLDAREVI